MWDLRFLLGWILVIFNETRNQWAGPAWGSDGGVIFLSEKECLYCVRDVVHLLRLQNHSDMLFIIIISNITFICIELYIEILLYAWSHDVREKVDKLFLSVCRRWRFREIEWPPECSNGVIQSVGWTKGPSEQRGWIGSLPKHLTRPLLRKCEFLCCNEVFSHPLPVVRLWLWFMSVSLMF